MPFVRSNTHCIFNCCVCRAILEPWSKSYCVTCIYILEDLHVPTALVEMCTCCQLLTSAEFHIAKVGFFCEFMSPERIVGPSPHFQSTIQEYFLQERLYFCHFMRVFTCKSFKLYGVYIGLCVVWFSWYVCRY